MIKAFLITNFSLWSVLVSLVLGLLYAFVFYKKTEKSDTLFYVLFALRTLLVTLLSFLLFSPLIKTEADKEEKPVIIIAQDNSTSIKLIQPANFNQNKYLADLKTLKDELSNEYDIDTLSFGNVVKKQFRLDYKEEQTNFSDLFTYIQEQYICRNVGAIILASDGIINKGNFSVNEISALKMPVYSIALGDTIPKKDLLITNVNYNKVVYLGNSYEIEIAVSAMQLSGEKANLIVKTSAGEQKNIVFDILNNDFKKNFKIQLNALKKGTQKVSISLNKLKGEISDQNNTQNIFIDVIDGRDKVLVLANAPHPDLSAIKESLESNKNYEVKIAFADNVPLDVQPYGLIIFHNLPSSTSQLKDILQKSTNKSKWFIVGNQTQINDLNDIQNVINASVSGNNQDYFANVNSSFNHFLLSESTVKIVNNLPPLTAPFGVYKANNSNDILINQKVANVNVTHPLLVFNSTNGVNTAVLVGEGLWRWRLDNFKKNENHDAFNEVLNKTVQYLLIKNDQRKFKVYPSKNRFATNEKVWLNAELYDETFTAITNAEIAISLKNDLGKSYSYIFTQKNNFYELDAGYLPEGNYTYLATARYGNKKAEQKGEFIVERVNVEMQNTMANHQLLYGISKLTNGKLYQPTALNNIFKAIKANEKVKTVVNTEKAYHDLINLKWVFFLLISILTFEWFLRKRNGFL